MVVQRIVLLVLAAGVAAALAILMKQEAAPVDRTRAYVSFALQGDLRPAESLLDGILKSAPTPAEVDLAASFRRRFIDRNEGWPDSLAAPFVREVMAAYRDYWTRSFMGEVAADKGEAYLASALRSVLIAHGLPSMGADDQVIAEAAAEVERRGLHVLGGITLPYFDLMIWARSDTARYEVELTDTVQPATVIFVSDFLIKGWSHFATFGRAYTGGWAASDALYCLREDYDLESEKFLISYLKHESRHFADHARFPALEQADLEYRAKLTELAYARTTLHDLIDTFAANAAPNPNAPHTLANYAVVRDLSRHLLGAETEDASRFRSRRAPVINAAARELLAAHTARLLAAGAETTRGIIEP